MSSHDLDSSPAERAAKRLRLMSATDNDDGSSSSGLALMPPEVWAGVMEYLPFDTILSCAATSRSMLHDAMPLLTKLHIDKASQINLTVASRFRDIREIHINSLLSTRILEEGFDHEITLVCPDLETKIRAIPFLSRFDTLDRVHFGGQTEVGENMENFAPAADYFFEGEEGYPDEGDRERMLAFIDLVSGAFRCGALPKHLKISGLCCPDSSNHTGFRHNSCETCLRACKSFPLEAVVCFECRGSSIGNARSGRMYGLDVCLERAQLESVIESRPGGRELLRSDERLLRLLGRGRRYKIASGDGKALHIVKYENEELDEIKRVITYAELDVRKLSTEKVTNAIMRSFARADPDPMPPKSQRHLAVASLDFLKDKIGLPIDKEDFESPLKDLVKHAHQFALVLSQCHAMREDYETDRYNQYEDVEIDCLRLVCQCLEIEDNPPIQAIVSAIPCLAFWLNTGPCQMEAASSMRNILAMGTAADREMVIEAGVIPSFSRLLSSSDDSLVTMAVLSLSNIVTGGIEEHIEAMTGAGAIHSLTSLLDSEDEVCVETSLRVLVVAAKDHSFLIHPINLLHRLVRILKSPDKTAVLVDCSILLRTILEAVNPPIQRVIDLDVVPRLVEIAETTQDHAMKTNLAHVMISLLAGSSDQIGVLVREAGFLSVLAGLVESPDHCIAEKAMSTVGKITDTAPEYRDLVVQAGIAKPLLQLLKHSDTVGLLKIASSTYAKCCRGKPFDFATTKAGLNVLVQRISTRQSQRGWNIQDNNEVVCNTCWALYHLLDGLTYEKVNAVINLGFVKHILRLLPKALLCVQEPALKSLYLIARAGDMCIKAITDRDGIACITKAVSSSHKLIQKLACSTMSNIISGNDSRIQAAIDNNFVSSLIQIITYERNNKHALWAIYQITKGGTAAQIKYMVTQDCVHHLCDILVTDCNTAIIALWALKNILRVGKEAKPGKMTSARSISSNIEMIEHKLEELTDENLQLEQQTQRVDLLQKKRAWLLFDAQNKHVKSLDMTSEVLEEQQLQVEQRLQSFEKKIASAGAETPLGKAVSKLHQKENEMKGFINIQVRNTRNTVSQAKVKLSRLLREAEKIAPKNEWYERLAKDDLPSDFHAADNALQKSMSNVKSTKATRSCDQRRNDIDAMKKGLRRLVRSVNIAPNKKKKRVMEDSDDSENDTFESPKKKVQAILSNFYAKAHDDANPGKNEVDEEALAGETSAEKTTTHKQTMRQK